MTRMVQVDTGYYALAFYKDNVLTLVINSDKYFEQSKAELMLSDRIANGEAFPGERVVKLYAHLQWFGEHTSGKETFPAHLFPKLLSDELDQTALEHGSMMPA